jgi:hypothetical protein
VNEFICGKFLREGCRGKSERKRQQRKNVKEEEEEVLGGREGRKNK